MSNRQKAFISVFLGVVLGGAVTTLTKVGLSEFPPLSFAFLRFLIASLIIIPLILKTKRNLRKDFLNLWPVSLLATANIVLFILGIRTTTATIGQLLYAGTPLLTALISYLFFREKLKRNKIIGIFIGFIGVLTVIFLPVLEKGQVFAGNLFGNLLIALGVICWSSYMVFSKRVQKNNSPFAITVVFIILTTFVLFPFFIFDLKNNFGWWNSLTFNGVISISYVALAGTVAVYLLNQYAIKHGGSIFASMSFYLLPVFAFLSAFVVLGERLTLGIVLGGIFVLLGVFLTTKK